MENGLTIIKNKEIADLFGVSTRAVSKWMKDWAREGILIPGSGTTRITSYNLADKYKKLSVSDIGFTK